uniref:Large ribosomal subunit protein uL23c n=1 Tax=Staurocarteria cerasiformis TaxID=69401 RepID=A0A0S2LQP3_STACE|nr:ribosomal protein L23 [Carteria cerasiformis]ALO63448.1 ribosomal protein L23 [Carteria cerasiformis]
MTNKQRDLEQLQNLLTTNEAYASAALIDLIKYPVITEKSYGAIFTKNQYTFDVDLRLNKTQIKMLFEKLFQVNIVSVNTHRPPRQKTRVGTRQGYKPLYKRVILTLKQGEVISTLNSTAAGIISKGNISESKN